MDTSTELTRRLGLRHPIIQAPMAGGTTTPELVAAVSEAGGLGSIGAAYLAPEAIVEAANAVRSRTEHPFAINLFAPMPPPAMPGDPDPALRHLADAHAELGLPAPSLPEPSPDPFERQFEAVLESGAAVFSFTFGIPPAAALEAARSRGIVVIGTATSVDEAVALEAAGVDAVVVQGSEAGAHRGTFAVDFGEGMVGTMALVPQAADAVSIPVIASGGIMDGRGVTAALVLGASAVQMGTAFLTCDEAGTSAAHRDAIFAAREHETRVTRAFSGRPARGIANRFMDEAERDDGILPYPLQNAATRPMRTAAARQGRPEYLSLWAGQGLRMARRGPATEFVRQLADEMDAALVRFSGGS